jgi:hypothetical protein
MFEEENEPELPTDGSGIFARDPGKSDIIQALAEKWGCTVDEACERLGLERPDPTDSIDAADRYGVDVVGCDEGSNDEDRDEDDEQSCPGVFVHWLPDPKPSEEDEYDEDQDEDDEDEDDDDLVGGDGLSGHGHRFEVVDEHLDLLGASKFGKDKTEATIVFMVDDYEEEDEAYFEIVIKLSNITWNGRHISTYTIDSVDLPDLDDYDESMIPDSAADINRLKEDAKRLLPRLKINKYGELEI